MQGTVQGSATQLGSHCCSEFVLKLTAQSFDDRPDIRIASKPLRPSPCSQPQDAMSAEWQVASRKGKTKRTPAAVSNLTCTTDFLEFGAGPIWTSQKGQAQPTAHAIADSVHQLRQQIDRRLSEVQQSHFLHSFQRLWAYAQHQHLEQDVPENSSHPEPFSAHLATEFVIFGLGSPSAGMHIACFAVG